MTDEKRPLTASLYLLTVFLSAFLLFQIQPLISKFILPWFGGSPAVWTTCMLFFQVVLFAGYIYAHVVVKNMSAKSQTILHIIMLVAATSVLPIIPDSTWKPTDASDPSGRIIMLLAVTVGLPYFVLSTTGPLLQGWYFRTLPGSSPYRLYSLSNIGSLLALLSYPFAVEPNFATENQALIWSWSFYLFAGCCAGCALVMVLQTKGEPVVQEPDHEIDPNAIETHAVGSQNIEGAPSSPVSTLMQADAETTPIVAVAVADSSEIDEAQEVVGDAAKVPSPGFSQLFFWFALAAVPSVMLLATTNQVCTDIAVVPFLWVLPLSLYLLSFILCFDSDRWYSRRLYASLLFVFVGGTVFVLWDSALSWQLATSIVLQASIFFGLMFCSCMVCHGELVRLKPHPKYLTTFYLSISAGGALGGLLVGMVAPQVFQTHFELHLGIIATCVLLILVFSRDSESAIANRQSFALWAVMIVGVGLLSWSLNAQAARVTRDALSIERNFYGVVRVDRSTKSFTLKHGNIRHGHQFVDVNRRHLPTTYYGYDSGAGIVLAQHKANEPKRVGVIGLGAGTLAVYAKPNDYYRMYEINPAVIRMVEQYFTYLSECKGKTETIVGDARIMLENEEPQKFDVLVLDAFSGDAVPTHLITKECCEIYLKHLAKDGILAFHVTNRHVDLKPICNALASEFSLACVGTYSHGDIKMGTRDTLWILLSPNKQSLSALNLESTNLVDMGKNKILWTDTFSNLLSVMSTAGNVRFLDK
jgi:hypothetical protein